MRAEGRGTGRARFRTRPHDWEIVPTKPAARLVETEVLAPDADAAALSYERDEKFIRFVSALMDTMFVIPGTNIRFGLDPVIGLIPGLGDSADAVISAYLIARSARHGVPKIILARMALNVLINTVGGSLPLLGDAFSVWWKSNAMNFALLQKHAGAARRAPGRADWFFVVGLILGVVAFIAVFAIGFFVVLHQLFVLARR